MSLIARILNDASSLPQLLWNWFGKRSHERRLVTSRGEGLEEAKNNFRRNWGRVIAQSATPGGGYLGIWSRDVSFILDAWGELGLRRESLPVLDRIWNSQITTQSRRVIFGRGSPRHGFTPRLAKEKELEKFRYALPTSIHRGFAEVYGAMPDIDSTALILTATCKILVSKNGTEGRQSLLPKLEKAVQFLESRDEDGDGLLEQGPNEDWMDSVLRSGKVVYSQGVWIQALRSWAALLSSIGKDKEAALAEEKIQCAIGKVDSLLWNGANYGDRLHNGDPNEQRKRINQDICSYLLSRGVHDGKCHGSLQTIKEKLHNSGLGPCVVEPPYKKTGPLKLKEARYQNGAFWPWLSSLEILARLRYNGGIEAEKLLVHCLNAGPFEWVAPMEGGKHTGRFPFRTGLAAVFLALRRFENGREESPREYERGQNGA